MTTLVEKAAAGSLKPMQTLYELYRYKVFYLCRMLLADDSRASCVTVEVFTDIWELLSKKDMKGCSEFEDSVLSLAAQKCCELLGEKEVVELAQNMEDGSEEFQLKENVFDGNIRIAMNAFELASKSMSKGQRKILILYACGLEFHSMSDILEMDENSLVNQVRIILGKLQRELLRLAEEGRNGVPQVEQIRSMFAQFADKVHLPPQVNIEVYKHIEQSAKAQPSRIWVVLPFMLILACLVIIACAVIDKEMKDEMEGEPGLEVSVEISPEPENSTEE